MVPIGNIYTARPKLMPEMNNRTVQFLVTDGCLTFEWPVKVPPTV